MFNSGVVAEKQLSCRWQQAVLNVLIKAQVGLQQTDKHANSKLLPQHCLEKCGIRMSERFPKPLTTEYVFIPNIIPKLNGNSLNMITNSSCINSGFI